MTPLWYPVVLNLRERPCVVVGGGRVAARKVQGLMETGARVTVISPMINAELQSFANAQQVEWHQSTYQRGTLKLLSPLLVFAATDDPAVNQQVAEEARTLGALVNVADSGESGDFHNMSNFRRGRITVAVSTGGASPLLGRMLAQEISQQIGEEYAQLAELLAEKRFMLRGTANAQGVWEQILASPLLDLLRHGELAAAKVLLEMLL